MPDAIGDLARLEDLSLQENQLGDLPESLGSLRSLRSFSVGHNRLRALPGCIGNLGNLQLLHADSNQLASLPSSIGHLARLEELDLHGNLPLRSSGGYPPSITRLQALQYLWLDYPEREEAPLNPIWATIFAWIIALDKKGCSVIRGPPYLPEFDDHFCEEDI